ncbi:amidohydrolase [Nostocoides sp. Soil756]|jgi:predicted amidohydrolase YtcJ|uniref:amidohydrolase n=1 Tax=Nostocoides sp. Soil756 TaxID=1736399 RepID=UPI0006F9A2B4|nr:amidohydrolase [Tetrasphaera sp. Soil756]KRE62528.1 amidohydrolase [Tetrasphaera sp. Soil756]
MPETVWVGPAWCPEQGRLDAVLAVDGRIAAVGGAAAARAGQPGVQVVDVGDGLLLPGFGDGHAHPLFGGLEAEGPAVSGLTSVEAVVAEVARWAAEHPEAAWVQAASYDSTLAPDGLFDARWLDAAVPDRPVMLRAGDYHTAWVNSRALALAGIDATTPEPALGEIPRRPDGTPLGTLREWGAVDLVAAVVPDRPLEARVLALERATRHLAGLGVTWVQDAWVEAGDVEAYLAASGRGALHCAVNLALYADPRRGLHQVEALVRLRERVRAHADPLLTAETVKLFADGVVEGGTAALLEPYQGTGCAHTGMLVWAPDELAAVVTALDAQGFQAHVHTIGDRAVRVALDALEHAARVNGPRDRRPVLAHLQLVAEEDRARLAALGVVANAEPLWAQLDAVMQDLTVPRLGAERAAAQYPWATLTALGTTLSFGSDWPVSSADPLEGVAVACSRQTDARVPAGGWTPAERLGLEAALTAYTRGTAHQAFRRAGTLRVGADADLVRLDRDPFSVAEPRDLDTVRVTATWLRGVPVGAVRGG